METKFNTDTPVINAIACSLAEHDRNNKILLIMTTKTDDKTTTQKIEALIFNNLAPENSKNLPYATVKIQQKSTTHMKIYHKIHRTW